MTKNQIEYQRALEDARHNRIDESTKRFDADTRRKEANVRNFATTVETPHKLMKYVTDYTESVSRKFANIMNGAKALMG